MISQTSRSSVLTKLGIETTPLAYGCMGFGGAWGPGTLSDDDVVLARAATDAALASGITFFDHADIYKTGRAEEAFGKVLAERPGLREQIVIQTKCGIKHGYDNLAVQFDSSAAHILWSVEQALTRLGTDYIDVLLLHRPDPLMERDEVARAFDLLHSSGKVKAFGVSNMSGAQMAFIQAVTPHPIAVNQLELSLRARGFVERVMLHNQEEGLGVDFPDGTMEYCQANGVQVQAWGSLARGLFTGAPIASGDLATQHAADVVARLAGEFGVQGEAIVLAWLMAHPAGIQPVIGTTSPDRIAACAPAREVADMMTRAQWYELLIAARGHDLP